MEIDSAHAGRFRLAATANSTAAAGVISSRPGMTLNARSGEPVAAPDAVNEPPLALTGVLSKVTAGPGAIHPGGLLVASAMPGHAMRAPVDPKPGTLIGKALLSFEHGTGRIEMLVMLR